MLSLKLNEMLWSLPTTTINTTTTVIDIYNFLKE
jgi:hypothetical protein